MKKILISIAMLFVVFIVNAQLVSPTEVAPDGYITAPAYKYIFGATDDTLTNADTAEFVVRVKGNNMQDFNIQIYLDYVSGTAGGKLKTYRSINGADYTVTAAADSITVASVTSDTLDTEVISLDNFLYPYLKFYYTQSGTAVTVPKIYIYTKEN